jgi:hypothetical protein
MRASIRNLVAALGVAACGLLAMPSPAHALVIEFDDQGLSGGVISQAGNIITGTNILFDIITLQSNVGGTVLETAECGLADTVSTVCVMNFSFNTTTNTGTISITTLTGLYGTGADNLAFSGDEAGDLFLAAGSTVLNGTLSDAGFIGGTIFGAEGTDTKAAELLDFFQVIVNGDFGLSTTEIKVAVTGVVTDADLTNSGDILRIPEPGMLTLFGLGLLGVGRKFRQRRSN